MTTKLNEKQKKFCREYLKDFNATQAAVRAGYSEASARQIASENLSKTYIQEHIQSLADNLNQKTNNDIERIITELQLIAFGSFRDVAEWGPSGLTLKDSKDLGDNARLVQEVKQTRGKTSSMSIKLYSKESALEMLGRYHKMFTDKLDLSGRITLEDMVAKSREAAE
jgi:phage terminase small subunit